MTKAAEPERKNETPKRPGGTKNLEKQVAAAERAVAKAEEEFGSQASGAMDLTQQDYAAVYSPD